MYPSMQMEELRCVSCRRLVGRGIIVVLEVKCPRCKAVSTLRPRDPPPPERPPA